MIASAFEHIKISGVSAAVPTHKVCSAEYEKLFGKEKKLWPPLG